MGAWEGQEDLVGVEGRKTTIRIYFMKRIYFQFFLKKKKVFVMPTNVERNMGMPEAFHSF